MSSMDITNLTKNTIMKMAEEGKRFDGRGLLDYRDIIIEYKISNKAEGSARIRLGRTEVLVGIKMAIGTPYPDSMDKGNLIVSGDLLPLASPRFEMGPPDFYAIELPRLVDRAIRESNMIDLSSLVIEKSEKVWTIYVDIYPINDDGNLIDAATICAVAALKNTVIPSLDKEGNINYEAESTKKLSLSKETYPFSITFYKIGTVLLLDPTREEEEACDVKTIFGLSLWNKQHMINSCQKSGVATLNREEIERIADLLPKKYDELNERLKKYF